MPRFRYVGPIAGIDIPLLRLTDVKPGDEFDVTDAQAELLGAQPDNYEPADKATAKIADRVQAEAAQHFEDLVPKPIDPAEIDSVVHVASEAGPDAVLADAADTAAQEG